MSIINSKGKPDPQPELTPEEAQELDRMQENCFKKLHRPMVVKVEGKEEIWYICEKCLDKWMKTHDHLKEIVVGFRR